MKKQSKAVRFSLLRHDSITWSISRGKYTYGNQLGVIWRSDRGDWEVQLATTHTVAEFRDLAIISQGVATILANETRESMLQAIGDVKRYRCWPGGIVEEM